MSLILSRRLYSTVALSSIARPQATAAQIVGIKGTSVESYNVLSIKGNAEYALNKTRPGVLALKKGMMTLYDEQGTAHPVTCLHIDKCQVMSTRIIDPVGRKKLEVILKNRRQNIKVVEMGIGRKSARQLSVARLRMFNSLGIAPKRHVKGFSVDLDCNLPVGHYLRAAHFVPGQFVDVQAKSIGKGFQGVMKRWGFKGFPASHGASLSHRSRGSNGPRSLGRVWKGTKMAGRMGGKLRTMQRLKVLRIDNALNLVYVRGAVPGVDNALVRIVDTRIGGNEELFSRMPPPYPTFLPKVGQRLPRLLVAACCEPNKTKHETINKQ